MGAQKNKKSATGRTLNPNPATEFRRLIEEASSSSHSSLRVLNFIEICVHALHERRNLFFIGTPTNGKRAGFSRRQSEAGVLKGPNVFLLAGFQLNYYGGTK